MKLTSLIIFLLLGTIVFAAPTPSQDGLGRVLDKPKPGSEQSQLGSEQSKPSYDVVLDKPKQGVGQQSKSPGLGVVLDPDHGGKPNAGQLSSGKPNAGQLSSGKPNAGQLSSGQLSSSQLSSGQASHQSEIHQRMSAVEFLDRLTKRIKYELIRLATSESDVSHLGTITAESDASHLGTITAEEGSKLNAKRLATSESHISSRVGDESKGMGEESMGMGKESMDGGGPIIGSETITAKQGGNPNAKGLISEKPPREPEHKNEKPIGGIAEQLGEKSHKKPLSV